MRKRIRAALVGLVLACGAVGPVAAGPLEDGLAAYSIKDYATALRLWRPLAAQGHASAQYNLGFMYFNGQGVPKDDAEAVKWYRLAAAQGNAYAQRDLAFMYDYGRGVPQNYVETAKWYRAAAQQGDVYSQDQLGFMYVYGRGVPQDYVLAHMWFNLAAAAGGTSGAKTRDFVAAKMTDAQIAEAQRLAREWKPTKAK